MATNARTHLKGSHLTDLYRKGSCAWNKWVEDNPNCDVWFDDNHVNSTSPLINHYAISFEGYRFPKGIVYFQNLSFGTSLNFEGAEISDASFIFENLSPSIPNGAQYTVSFNSCDLDNFWVVGKIEGLSFFLHRATLRTLFANCIIKDQFYLNESEVNSELTVRNSIFNGPFDATSMSARNVEVLETQFIQRCNFSFSNFNNSSARFVNCRFCDASSFEGIIGVKEASIFSFEHSNFDHSIKLSSDERFGCILDFVATRLAHPLPLHGIECTFRRVKDTIFWNLIEITKAVDPDDGQRLRRLKEIAETNKDQGRALEYKILEMQAARFYTTPTTHLPLEFIYWMLGDYGRSLIRPFWWLVLSWFVLASMYVSLGTRTYQSQLTDLAGLTLSARQILPFLPSGSDAMTSAKEILYGDHFPDHFFLIAFAQTIFSGILIFLIGLALRNRFRI